MGIFGTQILENDTSAEVYEKFYELLEDTKDITDIVTTINKQFVDYKDGEHSKTDFLFGLGLALWENCMLDEHTLSQIKTYINEGTDISIWTELDAHVQDIQSREKELKKFLKKVSQPRKKVLKKKKTVTVYKPPIFNIGDCLIYKISNGNYSGAIVIGENKKDTHYVGSNVIISTNINQKEKPTTQDLLKANVLVLNFQSFKNYVKIATYDSNTFKEIDFEIEVIANITINPEVTNYFKKNNCGGSGWKFLQYDIEHDINKKPVRRKIKVLSVQDVLEDLKLKETYNPDRSYLH